jgi:hypothetical protein
MKTTKSYSTKDAHNLAVVNGLTTVITHQDPDRGLVTYTYSDRGGSYIVTWKEKPNRWGQITRVQEIGVRDLIHLLNQLPPDSIDMGEGIRLEYRDMCLVCDAGPNHGNFWHYTGSIFDTRGEEYHDLHMSMLGYSRDGYSLTTNWTTPARLPHNN